jgi:putative methionine-R-sulfoxide reductase with GAF domain
MSDAVIRALLAAADTEAPREERARAAADIVRAARGYRWAGIYDVGDDEVALIGESGISSQGSAIARRMTIDAYRTVMPILGAESGIVIGTLDVESDRAEPFSSEDVAFLEECAAALRPLYD